MKKDPVVYLTHMLQAIEVIETYVSKMSKDTFLKSKQTQDAVIRELEIIGEAVKNLPREVRAQHPDVSWKDVAGMRDKLIHAYFMVDLELLWAVIQDELPDLKSHVQNILQQHNSPFP